MSVRERQLYVIILVLAVALAGVGGYFVASIQQSQPSESKGYEVPSSYTVHIVGQGVGQGEGTQLKTIVVSGLGTVAGKPNQAGLSLGATTEASTASEAVAKNAEIMNKVIDALKAYVPEKDIETASFSLYPRYSYDGKETLIGFEATHMLKVITADLDKVGQFIDKAVEAGANRVEGVYFTFTKERVEELNTLARQRAVEDAKAKADIIASSLGVKIVGVAGAVEQTITGGRGWEYALPAPTPAPLPSQIMPPTELEVSVVITVTYIIE